MRDVEFAESLMKGTDFEHGLHVAAGCAGGPSFPTPRCRGYPTRGTKSSRHAADTVLAALRPTTRAANTLAAALVNHHRRERYKRGAAAKRSAAAVTHAAGHLSRCR